MTDDEIRTLLERFAHQTGEGSPLCSVRSTDLIADDPAIDLDPIRQWVKGQAPPGRVEWYPAVDSGPRPGGKVATPGEPAWERYVFPCAALTGD
jgi:hypothetical protein